MLFSLPLLTVICLMLCVPLFAATVLYDFEDEADVQVWHDEGRETLGGGKALERAEMWATSGQASMRITSPAWTQGMGEWPAFETKPAVSDWSGHDRLYYTLTNVTPFEQKLMLFISDSQVATRSGLSHRSTLLPYSFQQVVINLGQFAARKVNPADIHVMHFFTERPPGDMEVYIDQVTLLAPGEPLPEVPHGYLQQFATLQTRNVDALRALLAETGARLRARAQPAAEVRWWVDGALADLGQQVEAFAGQVAAADPAILEGERVRAELDRRISRLDAMLDFRLDFARLRADVQVADRTRLDVAVGFATSMEKVLPRAMPEGLRAASRYTLELARNEKEAFQVLVAPAERDLRQVEVRVGDLETLAGDILPARQVSIAPVGYVETKAVPPYGSSHVGWWPDPILSFMSAVDIAPNDVQAFWVRVHAPKAQPAGLYRGKLEVLEAGVALFAFDLSVRVYPFAVPDASPLPLAITFAPHDHPTSETREQQVQWRESPNYPLNAWKNKRLEWGDFLADYYITYDSLYAYGPGTREIPDFEVLRRLHRQGRLGMFNLGYYGTLSEDPEEAEKWKESVDARIGAAYREAKELGLLEYAYIYGCDEHPAERFPGVERAAAYLREHFPGVLIMTTTYDHGFGTDSVIKSMDAFCPLTPRYNRELADRVRADGKQVWWYICCGPHRPYCNMFVEYPAIEGRLLMGAQTAKFRPDGFLYYQISIWNSEKPITSGPFTDWDPRSWTTYHGDGSWTCVGPGGMPLATIRLENFRDGLEDYPYVLLLDKAVEQVQASPTLRQERAEWLREAQALLEVPDTLVESMGRYSRDPAELYRWRKRLAEAIISAGLEE